MDILCWISPFPQINEKADLEGNPLVFNYIGLLYYASLAVIEVHFIWFSKSVESKSSLQDVVLSLGDHGAPKIEVPFSDLPSGTLLRFSLRLGTKETSPLAHF